MRRVSVNCEFVISVIKIWSRDIIPVYTQLCMHTVRQTDVLENKNRTCVSLKLELPYMYTIV